MPDCFERIREQYRNLQGDSTALFSEVLLASKEIGLDAAWAWLEQCVIEKRLEWLKANFAESLRGDDPVTEGYKWFYEKYLKVSLPQDGEIVEHSPQRLVMRWRNACPTLEACRKLGLDTRQICRKVYERPVREFLKRIDPRLRFERNYQGIRPYAPYCEETITCHYAEERSDEEVLC